MTAAESLKSSVKTLSEQKSLTDTPGGPKDQLRQFGIETDVWMTQFYQGFMAGLPVSKARYGGKLDAFLRVDAEKLGLWSGLKFNVQYEHYFGRDLNDVAGTGIIPVNTANAFIRQTGYKSGLSISVSQDIGENFSISGGKFNMVTLSGLTPLKGGDGIATFMHTGIAAPISGVTPPYIFGGMATAKFKPVSFTLMVYDPRNAQLPAVIEHPFEKGTTISLSATVPIQLFGLNGYHSFRGVYVTKKGINLEEIPQLFLPPQAAIPLATKRGQWYASYTVQQYLMQSTENPAIGWGMFAQAGISDGNPNPVKWSVIAGLGGNNLAPSREGDLWGVGYMYYGFSRHLLRALDLFGIERGDESGVEAFYNVALTPWLRVTGDLQLIQPWNTAANRATIGSVRVQTKF
jgi:porin